MEPFSGKEEEPVPEEFQKIMKDFVRDILTTFPEYEPIVKKWSPTTEEKMKSLFKHCKNVFPERFMDILYQNNEMFSDDSSINTEFLPGISFKYLWNSDISEKTKETIWKYLQLILIAMVGSIQNKESFGNAEKMFENVNEDEFKGKLQETIEKMQDIFKKDEENAGGGLDAPSADDIHGRISGMMDGKLGQLAREIAEETAESFNMDVGNMTNAQDVLQNILKNPGKMMNLVKNVGQKLESRMKSGDIKESELFSEATDLMSKMKNMPGMDNIQSMLQQMAPGLGGLGKNAKLDLNAMETQLNKAKKMSETKERMRKNVEAKKLLENTPKTQNTSSIVPEMTIDEILASLDGPKKTVASTTANKNKKIKDTKK